MTYTCAGVWKSEKQDCTAGRWDGEWRSTLLPFGSSKIWIGSTPHETAVFIILLSTGSLIRFRTTQIPHYLNISQSRKLDSFCPKGMQYKSEMLLFTQ